MVAGKAGLGLRAPNSADALVAAAGLLFPQADTSLAAPIELWRIRVDQGMPGNLPLHAAQRSLLELAGQHAVRAVRVTTDACIRILCSRTIVECAALWPRAGWC